MTDLSLLYVRGWGVAQDYAQARQWLQKAAAAGDAGAEYALSKLPPEYWTLPGQPPTREAEHPTPEL